MATLLGIETETEELSKEEEGLKSRSSKKIKENAAKGGGDPPEKKTLSYKEMMTGLSGASGRNPIIELLSDSSDKENDDMDDDRDSKEDDIRIEEELFASYAYPEYTQETEAG
ncbi:hypothetical protein TSUD_280590 [Trifolium subterraneum]|uniref:Uncharacterized protein n=1 Tax=Trifolium subterraneum TaxID=3900 RepID=A0A2Z6NNI2_TRISU|nr:hypothetical protein TSUD_280590 [Trifolium subterraneum]